MSSLRDVAAPIPAGDLQLYDYYRPALEADNYYITVEQTLTVPDEAGLLKKHSFKTTQEFIVAAPQFTLSPTEIINQYPPANSTGRYGEVLPHLVLKDPMLAWERTPRPHTATDSDAHTPWLALLVFEENELLPGDNPGTKTTTVSITDFLELHTSQRLAAHAPDLVVGDDTDRAALCQYIRLPKAVFQAVVPHLDELLYLSHVRKVDTGDRPLLGLNEHGLFSVTMANRFAHAPADAAAPPTRNIVHLVSLESLAAYLSPAADWKSYSEVALLSLASWTFLAQAEPALNFRELAHALAEPAPTATGSPATDLLRLPAARVADPDIRNRLALGYLPLAYHTRSGENTFAWYRGPLAARLPAAGPLGQFASPDAALVYDANSDVFDASLAAAWELGRAAALADPAFGPRLLDFRRQTYRIADALLHRLKSSHFDTDQLAIDELDITATVEDAFLDLLTARQVQAIGTVRPAGASAPALAPETPAATAATLIAEMQGLLRQPALLTQFRELLRTDLAPLGEWLARLLLLYPVPFDNLVPDERLLPAESLRFFYRDENWLSAAIDGALSLGADSTKHLHFSVLIKDLLLAAGQQQQAAVRARLRGQEPAAAAEVPAPSGVVSGFLLRSALVSGWPNLAVFAQDERASPLPILRIDHLAPGILLCLFDGVPHQLTLREPSESLRFGLDEQYAVLRHVAPTAALGPQVDPAEPLAIGGQFMVRPVAPATGESQPQQHRVDGKCLREPASGRVLNLAPAEATGLVETLRLSLPYVPALPKLSFNSSGFAMQLLNAAEAVTFLWPH